jgi:hypothetical protein
MNTLKTFSSTNPECMKCSKNEICKNKTMVCFLYLEDMPTMDIKTHTIAGGAEPIKSDGNELNKKISMLLPINPLNEDLIKNINNAPLIRNSMNGVGRG